MSEEYAGSGLSEQTADIAKRVNGFAVRKGWSKKRLCAEMPLIGSERTFRDMLAGRGDGYDLERQLQNLQAVWQEVSELAGPGETEPVFDDLTSVTQVANACLGVMSNWGINRAVIVLGESGIGKTTAIRRLATRYTDRVLMMETTAVWKDNPAPLLKAMLRQLGEGEPPISAADRFDLLVQKLSLSRRMIAVDEAHHLGPNSLNTIKSLINQTPGEFVLAAIPSLWAKLSRSAYMEARQLSTNRLYELVQLELETADIARFLRHRIPGMDLKLSREAGKLIRPPAAGNGNFSFVRGVADMLAAEDTVTMKEVQEAAQTELALRVESRGR